MANERTYPAPPCADIDQAIAFYETLGFKRTYRPISPNPFAVVAREDFHVHLFGIKDFVPSDSHGNVIVVVPDPDELYQAFATGLRAAYKKLPTAGIPRILRPRKKFGTVHGFSVVDVGGNWLRISKSGASAVDQADEKASGLARIVEVTARLGDAHGDESKALRTLENGLKRSPNAPILDYARALLYRPELAVRLGDAALARSSLDAARSLAMANHEKALIAVELDQTAELVGSL